MQNQLRNCVVGESKPSFVAGIRKGMPCWQANCIPLQQSEAAVLIFSFLHEARTVPPDPSIARHVLLKDALEQHRSGRLDEAAQCYRQILSSEPGHADCLHLLGMIAYQRGDAEQAVELIRRAIAIHRTAASYYSNLGNVLQSQEKLGEAEDCYRRALALRPGQAEVHLNLGHILKAQGDVDAALNSYRSARLLDPALAEAEVAESTALLVKGEFGAGWEGLEARWRTRDYDTRPRSFAQPCWEGDRIAPGRVLIWGEQGVGDEIMFAGLLRDVIARGNQCVLECDARLKPLFARSFPEVEVVSGYDPDLQPGMGIVAQLPSGSLPGLFRRNLADFAATPSPYLVPDAEKVKRFRARYHDGRPLVGIAWHSNNKKSGHRRSIDLARLAPLFAQSGMRWVSLQYGDPMVIEDQAHAAAVPLVIDAEVDQMTDLDSFAAQVAAMDLVVTIDNSTAHMAAALGVQTWTLLPSAPDWRWLLEREDSPWYPTMRLFRQREPGRWEPVIEELAIALLSSMVRR
jgi:ADP-heptose:LPS heptosyltransferase